MCTVVWKTLRGKYKDVNSLNYSFMTKTRALFMLSVWTIENWDMIAEKCQPHGANLSDWKEQDHCQSKFSSTSHSNIHSMKDGQLHFIFVSQAKFRQGFNKPRDKFGLMFRMFFLKSVCVGSFVTLSSSSLHNIILFRQFCSGLMQYQPQRGNQERGILGFRHQNYSSEVVMNLTSLRQNASS